MDIPKRIVKLWGNDSPIALAYVAEQMAVRGFAGPLTWKHGTLISFRKDVSDDIRVLVDLAKCGAGFDSTLFVLSKTLYRHSCPGSPWNAPPDKDRASPFNGYVTCLVRHLAHDKWARVEGTANPAWSMALGPAPLPDVRAWLADFDALQLLLVRSLRCENDLVALMEAALAYRAPPWVKSPGPERMPYLAAKLATFRTAMCGQARP